MMDFAEAVEARLTKRNGWKSAWQQESVQSDLEGIHFAVYAKKQKKMDGKMKAVVRNVKAIDVKLKDLKLDLKKACFRLGLADLFFAILAKRKKKTLNKVIVMNAKTFEKDRPGLKISNLLNLFKMKEKRLMKDIKMTTSLELKNLLDKLQTFTFHLETLLSNPATFAEN
jgi:hypothetical protein